nr:MAG TPA: hypothetical protein [Caudoviricetes sp.]
MGKIEIGEYVRTKSGFVGKVIGRHGGYGLHYELDVDKEIQKGFMNGIVHEDNIVKHSKNIIDLIECGDYVNGELVTGFGYEDVNGEKEKSILVEGKYTKVSFALLEWDIKTILTKEQMEANQYVVKRNMETN